MSRTYRKMHDWNSHKPKLSRNENQDCPYRFYRHERKEIRKKLWRAYRRKCKVWLEKFKEIPKWYNTNGWETW